jgi:hypothetical protein
MAEHGDGVFAHVLHRSGLNLVDDILDSREVYSAV